MDKQDRKVKKRGKSALGWALSFAGTRKGSYIGSVLLAVLSVVSGFMPYTFLANIVRGLLEKTADFGFCLTQCLWMALFFALAAGLLISMAATRWKVRFAGFLDVLAMTPLAVPGIVIAFGFLGMSVKYGWAREIFNPVENPLLLLAAAYAIRRLPYVVRSVSSGLEQTPEELENAARNMGAGPFRTLWKITLPLITANLVVGGLFAFSFSMLEVSDSLILAQKAAFFPITRAIFELSQILGSGPVTACAFGVWTMLFMATTLAAAGILLGRKIGAIFKM